MKTWLSIQVVHLGLAFILALIAVTKIMTPLEKPLIYKKGCRSKGLMLTYTRESNSKIALVLIDLGSLLIGAVLLDDYRRNFTLINELCSQQRDSWIFDIILIQGVMNLLSVHRGLVTLYFFCYVPHKTINKVTTELLRDQQVLVTLPRIKYQRLKDQVMLLQHQ